MCISLCLFVFLQNTPTPCPPNHDATSAKHRVHPALASLQLLYHYHPSPRPASLPAALQQPTGNKIVARYVLWSGEKLGWWVGIGGTAQHFRNLIRNQNQNNACN